LGNERHQHLECVELVRCGCARQLVDSRSGKKLKPRRKVRLGRPPWGSDRTFRERFSFEIVERRGYIGFGAADASIRLAAQTRLARGRMAPAEL
jgi:hypothetical protein